MFGLSFEHAFLLVDVWILHYHFFDVITTLGYFVSSYLFGVDIGSVRREETCDERCAWSYRSFIICLLPPLHVILCWMNVLDYEPELIRTYRCEACLRITMVCID